MENITYSYGDNNWKDKLTSYGGKSITYDSIGNMTVFDGQTFSWSGRRLNSYTKDSDTITYKYNADGIRTRKTSGGVKTEYLLNGSDILVEKRGSDYLVYSYGSTGRKSTFD